MSQPLLHLEHVGVRYWLRRPVNGSKEFWALKDVSLDVSPGETLGIIGSNGAGKSTLMRLLSGIIAQDRGVVRRKRGLRVVLLALGTGFEGPLTGRENAILSGMLLGLHRHTIEKRIPKIIEFSGLGEFIDQPLYTYSSGMIARLGFSVAMEVNPDVLLLDEIMGVGDISFAEKSANALKEKIRSEMTVVLISHHPGTIRDLCSKASWIHQGKTQAHGSVEEVADLYEKFIHGQTALPVP